ncbi:hypothetical protein QYF36_018387 [Acer negundo]|nr:hypothetical protein QYF36_018387 [Acer negundo]
MAKMKNSSPFFLFFFLLFFSAFADQSKETSFSFEGFDEDGENLTLEGALIMKPSGVLRLTNRFQAREQIPARIIPRYAPIIPSTLEFSSSCCPGANLVVLDSRTKDYSRR